jgi:hypothetical protein
MNVERVSEEVLFCCLGINTHPIASRRKTKKIPIAWTRGQNFVRSVEYGHQKKEDFEGRRHPRSH